MPPLRIDAHQHFWRYAAADYPWITAEMAAIRRDFLPEDLAPHLTAAGFDGSVLVQVQHAIDETRWLLQLADQHRSILGVVGWVDLCAPGVERELEALALHPRLVGIRHVVQAEPVGFMRRADFRRGLAALARFDLTYDILIFEHQLADAIDLAGALPDQRFVLDHIAKPRIRTGDIVEWRRDLTELARLPNVACKLSGMVTEADWAAWTRDQIRPYLETAIECFGPDRLMIGSDWPVCLVAAAYADTIGIVEEAIRTWSPPERAAVLGATAARMYRLPSGTAISA